MKYKFHSIFSTKTTFFLKIHELNHLSYDEQINGIVTYVPNKTSTTYAICWNIDQFTHYVGEE